MEIAFIVFVVVVTLVVLSSHNTTKRREALLQKYGDAEVVEAIMQRMFWQGQTQEQLLDSIGRPLVVDRRVLKNKITETWKYNQTGKNRFGLRVTLENGVVVGWDQK